MLNMVQHRIMYVSFALNVEDDPSDANGRSPALGVLSVAVSSLFSDVGQPLERGETTAAQCLGLEL